jgi:CheY-like chemotaxis protein
MDEGARGWVRVKDSGVGIAPEALPSVFEPFMQSKETIGRSQGGLGLGLALTKGLIELQGGTVSAQSDGPGQGAEFTLRFPSLGNQGAPPAEDPLAVSPARHPERRILIVEDIPDAALALRWLLELAGHAVAIAHDGKAGLEQAMRFMPEIVLCDISLPGMFDGYAVARILRGTPRLASSYLVALTGIGIQDDPGKAALAGFDAHLTKPVDPALLDPLIRQVPQRARRGKP